MPADPSVLGDTCYVFGELLGRAQKHGGSHPDHSALVVSGYECVNSLPHLKSTKASRDLSTCTHEFFFDNLFAFLFYGLFSRVIFELTFT